MEISHVLQPACDGLLCFPAKPRTRRLLRFPNQIHAVVFPVQSPQIIIGVRIVLRGSQPQIRGRIVCRVLSTPPQSNVLPARPLSRIDSLLDPVPDCAPVTDSRCQNLYSMLHETVRSHGMCCGQHGGHITLTKKCRTKRSSVQS